MSRVFVFDAARCNGCYNCQIACKDEHCDQPWLPYSEAQPLVGQFWMKVKETERGQVPWVRVAYEPIFCNHCADAPCVEAAPEAFSRREDGILVLDPVKARGLRCLVEACPIGAIYYNEQLNCAQKCAGCAHLLDNGWSEPRCVDACATEALRYREEDEIDLSAAEQLEELAGVGARVYYFNRPKRFIAGSVVDFMADEVVIGANVELLAASGVVVASQKTDDLGDFKFDQIERAAYTVRVAGKQLSADVTERDLSLGDIDVSQTASKSRQEQALPPR
jgi:Fe-S-cluster-containing dehydrogenase component